jgi:GDPmannose 4,6-dehydratase
MKTAMIIGISGQDGSYLAKLLLEKGYRVVGTSRDANMASFESLNRLGINDRVECRSMTLTDFRSVIQVFNQVKPDEIYNLAGQSSVGLSFEQPMETFNSISIGTLNLLEALRFMNFSGKLYNAGSSECFGNSNGAAADENTPFHPRSPYALAKSAAYWAVANYREAYGLFVCSGILFNHESPLRPKRFVTRKIVSTACRIAKGSNEKLILGNIDIQRDWGWAPEFVDAMWRMLQLPDPQDFVIATGHTYPLRDFVKTVFAVLGLNWREHTESNAQFLRPTEIMISRANAAKAQSILNWSAKYTMPEVAKMMVEAEMQIQTDDKPTFSRERHD